MPTQVLRLRDVILRTGISRSTIYERMSRGAFPKPIRLGERAVGWRDSDIEAWIESRPLSPLGRPEPRQRKPPRFL